MSKLSRPIFVFLAAAAILVACTSHSLQNAVPNAPQYAQLRDGTATQVTVKITIVAKEKTMANDRHPNYFSASSKGLLVQAYAHGKNNVLAEAAVDISTGSKACGGSTSDTRTCSATLLLAPSTGDDFVLSDYNAKPKNGKFNKHARLLAYGMLANEPVSTKAKKNDFKVFLGGVIARMKDVPATIPFAGNGQDQRLALMVDPVDFGNNPIIAGKKDPYANPIRVSVKETGAKGHTQLSLNGARGAKSVELNYSTDTVEVEYDGGGKIGYGATVKLDAPKVKRTAGATAEVTITPLILGSTSADLSAGSLALKGNGDYVDVQISEAGAPSGTTFTALAQHCDAIESTMPVAQMSDSKGSFAVIARQVAASPDPDGCVVTVSDGTTNLDLVVSNTYTGKVGTPVITETPTITQSSEPVEIAVGPDGNMWFAECGPTQVGRIQPTGTNPKIAEFPIPLPSPTITPYITGLQTGPDGKVWWTDDGMSSRIGTITTTGFVRQYSVVGPTASPLPEPDMIVAGSDGNMWFSEFGGLAVGRITINGAITPHPVPTVGEQEYVALAPDGTVWFTDRENSILGYVTAAGHVKEIKLKTPVHPWGITAGPDGNMWFAECNGGAGLQGAIGKVPVGATSSKQVTEYSTNMSGHQPNDITVGPDGALWYTYYNAGDSGTLAGLYGIGRIDTSGNIKDYAVTTVSAHPWGIASGPDGAVWFTENGAGLIARVKLKTSGAFRWPHAARRPNPHPSHHRAKGPKKVHTSEG